MIQLAATTVEQSWITFPEQGWQAFPIAPPSQEFLDTFDRLVIDPYVEAQRYRRFNQFRVVYHKQSQQWAMLKLDPMPFVQAAAYNSISGGVKRYFEELEPACNVSPYINQMLEMFQVDKSRQYHLDVHQYRVYGTPEADGLSVPEGAHCDGMEFVAILVFRRHLISGAKLSLINSETGRPFKTTTVRENCGIALKDDEMLHDATPVKAISHQRGYRDYIVININRWENRRYGSEFMARASNEIFQPRVKPINIAHLKETAITSYDHVVQMIKDGQLGALNVLHGIEGKVARIGSFDGLPFTQQNLIALQRGALLNAINHNYYQACKGWEDDRGNVAALHTLLHRLDAFAELNDGALPSKAHGLRFDESDLMPMVRDMNTWRQPSSPAYRAALGLH